MKITIYELLGLIKEGKAPKKIDYYGDIYVFAGDDYSLNDERERWFITQYDYVLAKFMKEEVEIIEEEKEIKVINKRYDDELEEYVAETYVNDTYYKEVFNSRYDEMIINKINQLIDVINDMRDKE